MGAWWELRLIGLPRRDIDLQSAALFALDAAGLQEDWLPGTEPEPRQPWDTGPEAPLPDRMVLRAWFEDPDRGAIERALVPVDAELAWAPVAEVDWETAWRASFAPMAISPRFVVAPPWDAPEGALIIEPGQGFGSGTHPTTQMALQEVDALADGCQTALDVGCGSGILAIGAAKLGLAVVGVDVHGPSIVDSEANAARNGVTGDFSTTPIADLEGTWDLVLGNLHAELILLLVDDLVRCTGTWLVLAGILTEKEAWIREALDGRLTLDHRLEEPGWVTLRYRR